MAEVLIYQTYPHLIIFFLYDNNVFKLFNGNGNKSIALNYLSYDKGLERFTKEKIS